VEPARDHDGAPARLHAGRVALPGLPAPWPGRPHDAVAAAAGALVRAGRAGVVALAGDWAGGGGVVTADPREVRRPAAAVEAFRVADDLPPLAGPAREGAVGGGWFGHLGFGLSHALWRRPAPLPATRLLPVAHWAWHDWVLRLDAGGRWWFEALLGPGCAATWRRHPARRVPGAPRS
jgi:para-aminobenzoate synthetase component 1